MAKTSEYGHLAAPLHPDLLPALPLMAEQHEQQWKHVSNGNFDLNAFRQPMSEGNLSKLVPETYPQPGKDFTLRDDSVPVRDGTKIPIRYYEPLKEKRTGKDILIMKFHGGGWVVGSHDIEEIENRLLTQIGAVVASVDYRMAPEYRFPYAPHDCYDALKWCAVHAKELGVDKDRIVLSGGSAGGNLVSVVALMARNEGFTDGKIVGVAAQIPAAVHPDLFPKDKYEGESMEQNAEAPILGKKEMLWFWSQYVPDAKADMGENRIYHSPLLANDLKGLPPFLIQVAGTDPLRDEGMAWAKALKAAGVDVELKVYPGLPHGFYFLAHLKESNEYYQAVVDFTKKHAGK